MIHGGPQLFWNSMSTCVELWQAAFYAREGKSCADLGRDPLTFRKHSIPIGFARQYKKECDIIHWLEGFHCRLLNSSARGNGRWFMCVGHIRYHRVMSPKCYAYGYVFTDTCTHIASATLWFRLIKLCLAGRKLRRVAGDKGGWPGQRARQHVPSLGLDPTDYILCPTTRNPK